MRREDLIAQAHTLRLDAFAVNICRALQAAEVECVVIKGVTTAQWLYSPPRAYIDVDVLVAPGTIDTALSVLRRGGIATVVGGEIGEAAEHSIGLRSPHGELLDLHVTLPMLGPSRRLDPLATWSALRSHFVDLDLGDSGQIPALDVPGRIVVLALHACNSGADDERVRADLLRARDLTTAQEWQAATALAIEVGIVDLLDAGVAIATGAPLAASAPYDVRLRAMGATSTSLGAFRLLQAPLRELPRRLFRELFPTRGFMNEAYGEGPLTRSYARRLRAHSRDLPRAVGELMRARRGDRGSGSQR